MRKSTALLISILLIVPLKATSREASPTEPEIEATPKYTPYSFPEGRLIEVDGVQYKAFTLEEYKDIGHILLSYELLWDQVEILETQNISLEAEKAIWTKRYELWKEQCAVDKKRGDLYLGLYEREQKMRLTIERSQKLATWVPWTIVVLEAIALAGFGIHQAVRE